MGSALYDGPDCKFGWYRRVVGPDEIRALKREHLGIDEATDVLSFPAFAPSTLRRGRPATEGEILGDIVIAVGVARRQARNAGHSLGTELRVLALHGLLHLLGYDHEHDDGQMARVERRLRKKAGLREGLIERSR